MKQKWLRNLKTAAALALTFLFCCNAAAKEEGFAEKMPAYSETRKIAGLLLEANQIKDGAWKKEVQKVYDSAKKKPVNEEQVEAMGQVIENISSQKVHSYAEIDRFIEDILNASMLDEKELLFPIAMLRQVETFLNAIKYGPAKEAKASALEELKNVQSDVTKKVKERFEDDDLKELVEEYLALFPDEKNNLFIMNGPGSVNNFNECVELAKKSLQAFWQLDKVSAIANFREWGRNMLNYLLLDNNEFMVEEFKAQLKAYKKVFKTEE